MKKCAICERLGAYTIHISNNIDIVNRSNSVGLLCVCACVRFDSLTSIYGQKYRNSLAAGDGVARQCLLN